MYVHRSHDARALAARLAEQMRSSPLPWNERERIAVQGRGMERWLAMQLADRLGGVAAIDFTYPRRLVDTILTDVLGEGYAGISRWEGLSLRRGVLRALPAVLSSDEGQTLRDFLDGERPDGPVSARRLKLADELAVLLDRYVTFRPDVLRDALAGRAELGEPWQAPLAREVRRVLGVRCPAEAFFEAIEALGRGAPVVSLPPRIALFGLTTVPPSYLRLLDAAHASLEVHLYRVVPSAAYFDPAERRRRREGTSDEADAHPLLLSLGRAALDFEQVLLDECTHTVDVTDEVAPPLAPAGTTLGHLQRDLHDGVLSLGAERPLHVLEPTDRSLRVHGCHGRTRQVEVVRDELLRAFVELPGLEPRDVVILSPQLGDFASTLRSVFDEGVHSSVAGPSAPPRLPVDVVERPTHQRGPELAALRALVTLGGGRVTAPLLVDVLTSPALAERSGLAAVPTEVIHAMIGESGMRWGIDDEERARFGQPKTLMHTIRGGLDRLLLACLVGEGEPRSFLGTSPAKRAFDRSAVAALLDAVGSVESALALLETPCAESDLGTRAAALAEALLGKDNDVDEAMLELAAAAEAYREPLDGPAPILGADALLAIFTEWLDDSTGSSGFQSGGITASGLVPMRAIPFRVVCLLGIDEASFPRRTKARAFDLVDRRPRAGDRRIEDDDRAAFLEALTCASDRLVITYQSRDPRENEVMPVSVPVAELLDTVARSCRLPGHGEETSVTQRRRDVLDAIVVHHRLHAFAPAENIDERTRGFDGRRVALARLDAAPKEASPPWSSAPARLASTDESDTVVVRLLDLLSALSDPTGYFVKKRAAVELSIEQQVLLDRETYELDALARSRVLDATVRALRAGEDLAGLHRRLVQDGSLPEGRDGERLLEDFTRQARAGLSLVRDLETSARSPDIRTSRVFDLPPAEGRARHVRVILDLAQRSEAGRLAIVHRLDDRRVQDARIEQAYARAIAGEELPLVVVGVGESPAKRKDFAAPAAERAERIVRATLEAFVAASERPVPYLAELGAAYRKGQAGADDEAGHARGLASVESALAKEKSSVAYRRSALDRVFGSPLIEAFDETPPASSMSFREFLALVGGEDDRAGERE